MRPSLLTLLSVLSGLGACRGDEVARVEAPWRELFDGATLDGWERTPFGGEGDVEVHEGAVVMEMGSPLTGIHWSDASVLPKSDYEVEVVATRVFGTDFFCGLTFPVGDSHASLILGGWGGALTGISCLDREDASANETRTFQS